MQGSVDFDMQQDFRAVHVSRVVWSKTQRTVSASIDAESRAKIVVQTPAARCHVQPMASARASGHIITMLFDDGSDIHAAFQQFLRDLQASCIEWGGLNHLELYDAVYTGYGGGSSFRVTAFSDALFYDTNASQVPSPSAMKACSCVLQLQGAWTSDRRFGLRWQVKQVKEALPPPMPISREWAEQDDDGNDGHEVACMFPLD